MSVSLHFPHCREIHQGISSEGLSYFGCYTYGTTASKRRPGCGAARSPNPPPLSSTDRCFESCEGCSFFAITLEATKRQSEEERCAGMIATRYRVQSSTQRNMKQYVKQRAAPLATILPKGTGTWYDMIYVSYSPITWLHGDQLLQFDASRRGKKNAEFFSRQK